MRTIAKVAVVYAALSVSGISIGADVQHDQIYPVAVLMFQERGSEVKELGGKVTDLVFAGLAASPQLYLVDREDLKKTLAEQELNLTGMVKPAEATKVGQLTGARIIVTGSVMQ